MIDFERISGMTLPHLETLLPEMLPGGRLIGREYTCGDLSGGPGDSLKVNIDNGKWADFADTVKGGDPVSLVSAVRSCGQGEAATWLETWLGIDRPVSEFCRRKTSDTWKTMPAPAPPAAIDHPRHGHPSGTWEYRGASGELMGIVCRFDQPTPAGEKQRKEIIPYTYGTDPTGKAGWRWKSWPKPRPLYGLDRLAQHPDAPVLVCEGEKDTDAAQRLLSEVVAVITWPGGSNAVDKADFSPLKGRRVAIWPDNDEPGVKAAEAVARAVLAAGAVEVSIVEVPPAKVDGWGLADAEAEGWTREQLGGWLRNHRRKIEVDGPTDRHGTAEVKVSDDATEIETQDWPIMDQAAFHGLAGEFVQLACRSSEADPAAVLATFLVRFGVECGRAPTVYVGDTRHHTRLAAVVVGASSKARKGTSAKPVARLFSDMEWLASTSPGPFSSGEGIIYAVRDAMEKWDEKKGEMVTADPGIIDKRLFVLDEEFAGALASTKREGNTLSMVIRCAWDDGTFDPLTKTNKIRATRAHVGWVSHITIDELHRKLGESEAFNGFANRILWVCARRGRLNPFPEPMPDEELGEIRQRIAAVLEQTRGVEFFHIKWGAAARRSWSEQYYQRLTQDHPGLVGCVVNRAEAQVVRLAMLYCLLDGGTVIEEVHLNAALAFWDYCAQSARYVFHGRMEDTIAQTILEAVEKKDLTGADIHALFNNHLSKARLGEALSSLIASGRIAKMQAKGAGRPKTIYRFQPQSCEISEKRESRHPVREESRHHSLNSLNSQSDDVKAEDVEIEI